MTTIAVSAKRILDWNYNPIEEKDIEKNKHTIHYEYDNAKDALLDLIIDGEGTTRRFYGECRWEFDKITKPLIHNGVKLHMYFTWKKYIFCQLFGIYQYIGEMS